MAHSYIPIPPLSDKDSSGKDPSSISHPSYTTSSLHALHREVEPNLPWYKDSCFIGKV
ncbi:hypothetical protein HMI54_002550 [Coelomomyces lativittatus]|nr:hypothetical protein HMI54_002550 [Coelomomyces lativittatus]